LTTAPDTAAFYSWWVETFSIDRSRDTLWEALRVPSGVLRSAFTLTQLPVVASPPALRPPPVVGSHWDLRRIPASEAFQLLVWLPTDSTGLLDSGADSCSNNRAWLAVEPLLQWIQLPLNPHCDETVSMDEVDFALYWLPGEPYPHLELVTNGPACVPSWLFRYASQRQRFELARTACAS
jgi:hypothetical protein